MPDELAVKVADIEQRSKSNTHRLDKLEKRQDDMDKLVTSVATLAKDQEYIQKDVTEIKSDVKQLTEKPAKRWEAIVDKVIWAVIAAALGFVLAKIGLG